MTCKVVGPVAGMGTDKDNEVTALKKSLCKVGGKGGFGTRYKGDRCKAQSAKNTRTVTLVTN